jgi:GTP-binding protein YchF
MTLSIGIVGLPNVGKSTLFNALTKKSVEAANYPFCTIDPSVGVVSVPDDRLYLLSDFSKTKRTVPAAIQFVDIAGLVAGASSGEGLGNKFLSHIREVDAIAQVVRIFDDSNIVHVGGKIDPLADIEVINLELALADLQTVIKRIANLGRDVKKGDKEAIIESKILEHISAGLEKGILALQVPLTDEERLSIKSLNLLTMKPMLYVLNKKGGGINLDEGKDERYGKLMEYLKDINATWVVVDARIEEELKDFEGEEKEIFRVELGGKDDGINDLIKESYALLGLMSYFTTGIEETRSWTVKHGASAPEAGQAIHTDFKDKFIRAEIIPWKELLDAGSFAVAREKGLLRTEGKEYIVKDGDVVEFKI